MFQVSTPSSRRTPGGPRGRGRRWRVATKVNDGTSTSSPGPTPTSRRARWRAAVPLDRATAWPTPDPVGELALEGVDVGPERGDPVGVEGVEQHAALLGAHLGRREVDPAHGAASGRGDSAPAQPARATSTAPTATSKPTAAGRAAWRATSTATDGQRRLDADVGQAGGGSGPAPGHQAVVGMAPVAGHQRPAAPEPAHHGEGHLGGRHGHQGQGRHAHPGRPVRAPRPGPPARPGPCPAGRPRRRPGRSGPGAG